MNAFQGEGWLMRLTPDVLMKRIQVKLSEYKVSR